MQITNKLLYTLQVELTAMYGSVDEVATTNLPNKATDICDGNSHEIRGKLSSLYGATADLSHSMRSVRELWVKVFSGW